MSRMLSTLALICWASPVKKEVLMLSCGGTMKAEEEQAKPHAALLRTCSVSAKISGEDTRPLSSRLVVVMAIRKSSHTDALWPYHSSNFCFSSLVRSLAPLTCAHPLIPGRTESLIDVFVG